MKTALNDHFKITADLGFETQFTTNRTFGSKFL